MKKELVILECPKCSTKQEVELTTMYTKKIFRCGNKKCKFGAEYHKWIKRYSTGEISYPN
jgi:hypothetical protein